MLSKNADYVTTEELSKYLLFRLEELIAEYSPLDDNSYDKHYLAGVIAGFETVLVSIGYPADKLPEHEELL